MVFASHCTQRHFAERRSPFIFIACGEHCVFVLLLIFMSEPIADLVDYIDIFDVGTALTEMVVIPLFPLVVHAFVADIGPSVLRISQFDFKEAYLS